MDIFILIFVLAFIVEAIWENLKYLWPRRLKEWEEESGIPVDYIGTFLIALGLCYLTGADVLKVLGVDLTLPFVGVLITALFMFRGSHVLHDIIKGVQDIRNNNKPISYIDADKGGDDRGETVDPLAGVYQPPLLDYEPITPEQRE